MDIPFFTSLLQLNDMLEDSFDNDDDDSDEDPTFEADDAPEDTAQDDLL